MKPAHHASGQRYAKNSERDRMAMGLIRLTDGVHFI